MKKARVEHSTSFTPPSVLYAYYTIHPSVVHIPPPLSVLSRQQQPTLNIASLCGGVGISFPAIVRPTQIILCACIEHVFIPPRGEAGGSATMMVIGFDTFAAVFWLPRRWRVGREREFVNRELRRQATLFAVNCVIARVYVLRTRAPGFSFVRTV